MSTYTCDLKDELFTFFDTAPAFQVLAMKSRPISPISNPSIKLLMYKLF